MPTPVPRKPKQPPVVTLFTAAFFIVAGAVTVFFEIKPFWLDEWF